MAAYPNLAHGVLRRGIERRARLRPLGAALVFASAFTVSACAPPSLRDLMQSAGGAVEAAAAAVIPSRTEPPDPLLTFLAEAAEGEIRDLDDSATGARLRVRAGRAYHAASGRLCRRYRSMGDAETPEAKEEGLVCRDASGHWKRAGHVAPVSP